ncbi:MAG: hypothetical protein E7523_04660 [Ruminococcaceae bacterium]|nr:hypothetical protein [Oscillospiraceae bacterium]
MARTIFIILLIPFVHLIIFRPIMDKIIELRVNKGRIKSLQKKQSVFQWLFYTRFRFALPKVWLYPYYFSVFLHLALFVFCIVLLILGEQMLCEYVAKKILLVNAVALLLLRILFWQADFPHIKIERWVTKEIPKEKQKQGKQLAKEIQGKE